MVSYSNFSWAHRCFGVAAAGVAEIAVVALSDCVGAAAVAVDALGAVAVAVVAAAGVAECRNHEQSRNHSGIYINLTYICVFCSLLS